MSKALKIMGVVVWVFVMVLPLPGRNKIVAQKRVYTAQRINPKPPMIDGRLDDSVWEKVEWGTDFSQKRPYEGEKPSQETAFKILYDDKNIYVGIRAFDTKPDEIIRRMARRDNREGDWVQIIFDSYHDHRTGFAFGVNAAGVKNDMVIYDDGDNRDRNWDPIWYVKTAFDTKGWTAEMKIPLSQLRFGGGETQTWGFHVVRFLHRLEESSEWSHIPRNDSGYVSLFGELHGLNQLKPKRQVELLPYTVGKHQQFEKEEGNPFADGSLSNLTGGLDGKIGITNDLTLDFTINPDFGQVEADPSEVNLTAFETFFQEKRPFFIEGRNILDYGITFGNNAFSRDNLFYSRRIGRRPHHDPDLLDDEYVDMPDNTTILGAFKLTGKTRSGLSIGILDSVTAKESATIDYLGDQRNETVEPLTNYFILRLQKDYNEGNTTFGGIVTAVNRDLEDEHLDYLHKSAYTGGLDFSHKWKNKEWLFTIKGIFSHVKGDKEAILDTQESSLRYYQRPDADYLTLDPNRTSLTGHGGDIAFGKVGGGRWRFVTALTWRSPGLELNDVGYLRSADRIWQVVWIAYQVTEPFSIFRNFFSEVNQWHCWNFGGESLFGGYNMSFNADFKNYWGIGAGINRNHRGLDTSALRGGPALKFPGGISQWFFLSSDGRKKLRFHISNGNYWGDLDASRSIRYSGGITYRPSDALLLSLRPSFRTSRRELQYVETVETDTQDRYVFAHLEQKTVALTVRLNYSITPDLSIQFYGQPFISSGKYTDFKYITDSRAKVFEDRYQLYKEDEISYDPDEEYFNVLEEDGKSYGFEDPNFNFLQFRSNLVVRWEYTPGSTVYLVWSQGRTDVLNNGGDFEFRDGMRDLFHVPPHNVFLIKFTYRFKI
jgi:hypothetical protein